MRLLVCAPIMKSRQTYYRAVSPSVTPYCCLRILLCYLLPGCVTSALSLNNGIVTLTGLCKKWTKWRRMADDGQTVDRKLQIIKCRWKYVDGKMQMAKCG